MKEVEVIYFYDGLSRGGKHKYTTAPGSLVFGSMYFPRDDKSAKPLPSITVRVPHPEQDKA